MCLDEIVRCVAGREREEVKNENLKALFNKFSKHDDEILTDLVEEKVQDQGCAHSFISFHPFVTRSGFVAVSTLHL